MISCPSGMKKGIRRSRNPTPSTGKKGFLLYRIYPIQRMTLKQSKCPHDVRLGDIVVSTPTRDKSGVLPYDMVKTLQSGVFQLNGCLSPPPRELTSAISELRSDPKFSPALIQKYLHEIATYPGQERDILFVADYVHNDHGPCDTSFRVQRNPRPSNDPVIHYGLIASGNQLMRCARTRDRLSATDEVLCFEMEAAGVMNTFQCLVIRGICDYADSHKNKTWQKYAAASAAAFAKVLLLRLPKCGNEVISLGKRRLGAIPREDSPWKRHQLDRRA
ncbi:hypothetical protein ASPZODRAFT_509886 [Penicilliopsis zonata CBS 506.65]|uniref:Uncharacterized protein n=1 Tax=Penicilliopsis zonata CBS 506.65 TaxID=1073090 RepID=A0A1L9SET3_9EURO|nr:hypothetical protein ASPZODRAFT_509886 [Penicilliopsis zonata CBS 506.65]OJJ45679.1 hypothetical protein ASPZODRAFT_509886 [Penicilliopsis zonata CBS 506.65]